MTVQETLAAIRKAIAECDGPEIVLLEELQAEAEGGNMRIADLEAPDAEGGAA